MTLTDNDPPMDQEIQEILESLLREHLSSIPEGKWFSLKSLYSTLEIKFTLRRQGSLDRLIDQLLDDWNWRKYHSDYWGLSYVRRNLPTDPVSISLIDGNKAVTRYSWPDLKLPEPRSQRKAEIEAVRQKILQCCRARNPVRR